MAEGVRWRTTIRVQCARFGNRTSKPEIHQLQMAHVITTAQEQVFGLGRECVVSSTGGTEEQVAGKH